MATQEGGYPRHELTGSHYRRRGRIRSTSLDLEVDVALSDSGIEASEPITISQSFRAIKKRSPDHPALRYEENKEWKSITFAEYYALCMNVAKSFLKVGLKPLHAVAIIGSNSPKWVISELGAILAGGVIVGIFAGKTPEGYQYVAHRCRANVIVVEQQAQLEAILKVRGRLPLLKAIVLYGEKLSQCYPNVYEWEEFLQLGEAIEDGVVEEVIEAQKPGQCALIVHSSGTTGEPKGIMLSHDNLTWSSRIHCEALQFQYEQEHFISYIPPGGILSQLGIFSALHIAATLNFAQPDAMKGSILNTLKEVHPTHFFGVPSIYDSLMRSFQAALSEGDHQRSTSLKPIMYVLCGSHR